MSHLTKVAGVWRNSKPYTKVAGTWKLADYVYNKVGGRWYTSFVKGGLVDKSWNDRDQTGQFGAPWLTGIREAVLQSDGKILVGGEFFTSWNGVAVGRFVRLNAAGSLDTNFNNNLGTGFNSTVFSIIPKSNGQILIGGNFTTLNSVAAAGLVLLNADGTRDAALDTSTGINTGNIYGAEIQSNGQILIGGSFTAWKGTTANYFTRINSNGTLDTGFNNNLGTGPNGAVLSVKVQSDGRIIVAGQFGTWNGVTVANGIVRLETTGVRDTAFTTANGTGTGLSQVIYKVAIQSDGKILLGGDFTSWNGTTVGRIVRLESTGALDTAFTTNTGTGASGVIYSFAIQSDGKIVVGGIFTSFNSVYVGVIVRLNSTGANSDILSTFASSTVQATAIQSDGKIVVCGAFTSWNGTTVGRIVRLNADGTRDTTFTTNTGTGANLQIEAIAIEYDDNIVIGGGFTSWNGTTVGRIVRLIADGTRDTAFTTLNGTGATTASSSIFAIAIDSSDRIVIGGSFTTWNGAAGMGRIVRLGPDGLRDTSFNTQTGTGANGTVLKIVIGDDDRILVGGVISLWNGVTVGRIVRLESNGARDTAFTTANGTGANSNIQAIAIDSSDRIVIGGTFTTWNGTTINRFTRLNSDGTLDTGFTTSMGTGFENGINSITIQHDKKILVGGAFVTCRIGSEFRRFFVRIGGEDAS
jgi:uncharacterized delta-60 repeat protein